MIGAMSSRLGRCAFARLPGASQCSKVQSALVPKRGFANKRQPEAMHSLNMKIGYYMSALALTVFGVSYASVPLYKAFCQMTGFGGTTQVADEKKAKSVKPIEGGKIIKVYFTGNVHSTMPWKFRPTQNEVRIVPGETALAFYTVSNTHSNAISGVATYNVYPPKAGLYFNKIQCFCFEEQRLGGGEEIDMPVFFFIDPEIAEDPSMENVTNITLSYTFFKTGEEMPEEEAAEVATATTATVASAAAT
jgi:cytochrome c oxidase assembly protein subunit 11